MQAMFAKEASIARPGVESGVESEMAQKILRLLEKEDLGKKELARKISRVPEMLTGFALSQVNKGRGLILDINTRKGDLDYLIK